MPDRHSQECVASAQCLLEFFGHHPERPVEFNVTVDTVNGAGPAALSLRRTAGQTAFTQVLLKPVKNAPQVILFILPATGTQHLDSVTG